MQVGLSRPAIRGILRRKINDWLASIEDEALRKQLHDNCIVTGGALVSLLQGEPVNDFDVYMTDRDTVLAVTRYYVERFTKNPPPRFSTGNGIKVSIRSTEDRVRIYIKSVGVAAEQGDGATYEYFESTPEDRTIAYVDQVTGSDALDDAALKAEVDNMDPGTPDPEHDQYVALVKAVTDQDMPPKQTGAGAAIKNRYRPIFLSENAITLSDKIQLVIRFYGDAAAIHRNFDYQHCLSYYVVATNELVVPYEVLECLRTKKLQYIGSLYPVCSLVRMKKFLQRGWNINAGQMLKILYNMQAFDLNDIDVLREQLIGVDVAYFHELIELVKKEKDNGKTVDASYISLLIDKLF